MSFSNVHSTSYHAIILESPDTTEFRYQLYPMDNKHCKRQTKLPHARMTDWYNPRQLFATAMKVIVSIVFSHHADNRRFDALSNMNDLPSLDYSNEGNFTPSGFWIDYLADTGDGWDSTYAVASAVAADKLTLCNDQGDEEILPRSRILILGGDLVYPTPSIKDYEQRLLSPFVAAYQEEFNNQADVLALPGNHDWYDSLVAFRRIFCSQRNFAWWNSKQSRSYFYSILPGNWWLFGLDTQLVHDIDEGQLAYFRAVAAQMPEDAKVILCTPEPFWLKVSQPDIPHGFYTKTFLEVFVEDILGARLRLAISGDLHHYRRYSSLDQNQHRITCGTGGAFLHPTHNLNNFELDSGFRLIKSFPDEPKSRRLTYRNILFLFKNPMFGIVTGVAYLMVAWANGIYVGEQFGNGKYAGLVVIEEIGRLGFSEFPAALLAAIHSAILSPVGSMLYLIMFLGFIFFTDSTSKIFRIVAGIGHSLAHIFAGFLIYWLAAYISITIMGFLPKSIPQYLTAGSILFVGGWIIGSTILGIYLMISLNLFGKHANEAFSSLKIKDWKGFLRLNIDNNSNLHVYFIGIKHVPRYWKKNTDTKGAQWLPNDSKATKPCIIDKIIL